MAETPRDSYAERMKAIGNRHLPNQRDGGFPLGFNGIITLRK